MLALMTILALVAWPITFWRQVTYQFRAFTPNHPDDPLVRQYRNISSWPDDDIVEPDFRMIAVISRGTFGVTLHHIRITSPFEYVLTPVGNSDPSGWAVSTAKPVRVSLSRFTTNSVHNRLEFLGLCVTTVRSRIVGQEAEAVALPLWMIALVTSIPAFFLSRGVFWRRRRPDECRKCGYSRVGLPINAACPECGGAHGAMVKANAEVTEGRTEIAERGGGDAEGKG
ncbi:MAG: hypothetical protein IPK69_12530 [Phycisphaerales bacterium]|nr:MAG: hypothetical protein IPK69_12530 [Phycisphaerales bacterium]